MPLSLRASDVAALAARRRAKGSNLSITNAATSYGWVRRSWGALGRMLRWQGNSIYTALAWWATLCCWAQPLTECSPPRARARSYGDGNLAPALYGPSYPSSRFYFHTHSVMPMTKQDLEASAVVHCTCWAWLRVAGRCS